MFEMDPDLVVLIRLINPVSADVVAAAFRQVRNGFRYARLILFIVVVCNGDEVTRSIYGWFCNEGDRRLIGMMLAGPRKAQHGYIMYVRVSSVWHD